ncbi:3'(2'),5'-bisphosphate nucleotidase CysQ [Mesorhizobium sp. ANAO-SY3R2]|uniref:3'(2'),5'-bisphosphate nucleotidase CysQ n=1 Tax=Mesorhizobium sp. ANAO-SY3R2 TaxID=3166644 RepID=UPI0036724403
MPGIDTADGRDLCADLELLRSAAVEAGRIAMRYFRNSPEVWFKDGNSPVSEADYATDKYLRETLTEARPDYGWLSEETADNRDRLGARRTFVVDPIDGTRGFVDGRTAWCVSVAIVENGGSLAGVLECPARDETYWAVAGEGAFLNGEPIRVRGAGERLRVAGPKPMIDRLPDEWLRRIDRESYIPSLAYRVAMIAKGTLDATFVKPNAHDWDIAAAELILREAGGSLLDSEGRVPTFAGEKIVHGALMAGSGELFDAMGTVIAGSDG